MKTICNLEEKLICKSPLIFKIFLLTELASHYPWNLSIPTKTWCIKIQFFSKKINKNMAVCTIILRSLWNQQIFKTQNHETMDWRPDIELHA